MEKDFNLKAMVGGKEVTITLTKEQLNEIKKQTEKPFDYRTIKSYEDACERLGVAPCFKANVYNTSDEVAYKKLKTIFKAINNGWTPDWDKTNQYKYYPYFCMGGSSGFGFSGTDCLYDCRYAYSAVSSRLCTYSCEVAKYIGTQFKDIYKEYMTI